MAKKNYADDSDDAKYGFDDEELLEMTEEDVDVEAGDLEDPESDQPEENRWWRLFKTFLLPGILALAIVGWGVFKLIDMFYTPSPVPEQRGVPTQLKELPPANVKKSLEEKPAKTEENAAVTASEVPMPAPASVLVSVANPEVKLPPPVTKSTTITSPQSNKTEAAVTTLVQQIQTDSKQLESLNTQIQQANSTLDEMNSTLKGLTKVLQDQNQQQQEQEQKKQRQLIEAAKVRQKLNKRREQRPRRMAKTAAVYHEKRMDYFVRALIPGRAWLRDREGRVWTVSVGDYLPGYGRILDINTQRNMVFTSSGRNIYFGIEVE